MKILKHPVEGEPVAMNAKGGGKDVVRGLTPDRHVRALPAEAGPLRERTRSANVRGLTPDVRAASPDRRSQAPSNSAATPKRTRPGDMSAGGR
jgi:hypothetical protein